MSRFADYPNVPFDVDKDITRAVLESCTERIKDNYYKGRMHGLALVIDKNTAYYNASAIMRDEDRLKAMMGGEVMKAYFEYIKTCLGRDPYYRVDSEHTNPDLNGIYMHAVTIGNVSGGSAMRG